MGRRGFESSVTWNLWIQSYPKPTLLHVGPTNSRWPSVLMSQYCSFPRARCSWEWESSRMFLLVQWDSLMGCFQRRETRRVRGSHGNMSLLFLGQHQEFIPSQTLQPAWPIWYFLNSPGKKGSKSIQSSLKVISQKEGRPLDKSPWIHKTPCIAVTKEEYESCRITFLLNISGIHPSARLHCNNRAAPRCVKL